MPELGPLLASLPAGTVSGWLLVLLFALGLVKAWPALRKLKIEEDGSLRGDLLARITRLEDALSEERRTCAEQLAEIRRDYEARLSAQGRQIDHLQRELYILRAAAMQQVDRLALDALVKEFDRGGDDEASV